MSDELQDEMTEAEEEQWCDERRAEVVEYLARTAIAHRQIGEWPAWHLPPYVSLWAIESGENPGWVGWWVICGDLPTDYVSAQTIKHPREAMRALADRWAPAAERMARSEAPEDFSLGQPEDWPTLAPLLASRAALLQDFAADDAMWEGY
ncbi:MAG: DUF4826 family protein [Armatimonadota bacterium]|jgi:hypothetical protein|nr:DUF4826 family protein [Fimbriimonadaceae bacterium]